VRYLQLQLFLQQTTHLQQLLKNPKRAAVLIISADRGMAGAYSNNAIKEGEQLAALVRERGLETKSYLVGRKAVSYYKFRNREIAGQWTGFSDNPTYEDAREVADALIEAFILDAQVDVNGVDEIHIVFTEFKSMLTQNAMAKRMLPLEVVESEAPAPAGLLPMYEFEPSSELCLMHFCLATFRLEYLTRCCNLQLQSMQLAVAP
jgi:F-type H+-transporting ATPase subunit gamma